MAVDCRDMCYLIIRIIFSYTYYKVITYKESPARTVAVSLVYV
jgi:hypothetical protein